MEVWLPIKGAHIAPSHNQGSLENQALCPRVICQLLASRGNTARSEWVLLCSVTLLMTHAGLWVTNLCNERLSCTLPYTSEFHGILVTVIGNTIWWGIANVGGKLIWCTAISQRVPYFFSSTTHNLLIMVWQRAIPLVGRAAPGPRQLLINLSGRYTIQNVHVSMDRYPVVSPLRSRWFFYTLPQFVSAGVFSLQISLMPACVSEHFFPILFC